VLEADDRQVEDETEVGEEGLRAAEPPLDGRVLTATRVEPRMEAVALPAEPGREPTRRKSVYQFEQGLRPLEVVVRDRQFERLDEAALDAAVAEPELDMGEASLGRRERVSLALLGAQEACLDRCK